MGLGLNGRTFYIGQNPLVKRSNDEIFNVFQDENPEIVDLKERACTCNKFQLDQLPCEHALAVLRELNQEPYTYCSPYYTTKKNVSNI